MQFAVSIGALGVLIGHHEHKARQAYSTALVVPAGIINGHWYWRYDRQVVH